MDKKLKILGKEYVIESDLPPIYMEKIAEYVDSKFRLLSDSSKSILEIAILVALNIADELFQEIELNRENREIAKQTVEVLEKELFHSQSQIGSLGCS